MKSLEDLTGINLRTLWLERLQASGADTPRAVVDALNARGIQTCGAGGLRGYLARAYARSIPLSPSSVSLMVRVRLFFKANKRAVVRWTKWDKGGGKGASGGR